MGRPTWLTKKKKGAVADWRSITECKGEPVIVEVRSGNGNQIPILVMRLYNVREHVVSYGAIPYELDGYCPRCGDNFRINGERFAIHVDRLPRETRIKLPYPDEQTGQIRLATVIQKYNISVEGARTCVGDDSGGKGICGYKFVLTDNVMSPV